jgi:acetoin utilization deacetylase AcuC-like enzyme
MKIFYCDHFVLPLPDGHRFPMDKYARLRDRVAASLASGDSLHVPAAATDEELQTVHESGYVRKVQEGRLSPAEIRRMGFPWSPALVERSRRSVGGTLGAAKAALEEGVAVNLSGGTHHAFVDRGEGYCVFNDVAVATRTAQNNEQVGRVAILDLDVHQGNGTAAIFKDDPSVFTFSVHGANNFPFQKEAGDLDIELPDGAGDNEYLGAVEVGVEKALDGGRTDVAFFLAGADPFHGDRLGRLGVSKAGLEKRDRLILEACSLRGIPVAVVMGGGYAPDIEDIVDIHYGTIRAASRIASNADHSPF